MQFPSGASGKGVESSSILYDFRTEDPSGNSRGYLVPVGCTEFKTGLDLGTSQACSDEFGNANNLKAFASSRARKLEFPKVSLKPKSCPPTVFSCVLSCVLSVDHTQLTK